jgi:hypothetical protein
VEIKIGSHIGRWTVLEETRKNGKRYYKCICECGTVKEVYYRSLELGISQSCGCLRSELQHGKAIDLTGQHFGKLVVLGPDKARNGYFICECDCGNSKSIKGTSLTKSKNPTISCGCEHKKVVSETGKKTIYKNMSRQVEVNVAFNTNFQVIENDKLPKNNTSGHKGIWWDKNRKMWQAYIGIHGKRIHLGRFYEIEDAIKARKRAEEEYYSPIIEEKRKGG